MDSLQTTDAESAAVQKTRHRVTLADIEAAIEAEFYLSSDAFAWAAGGHRDFKHHVVRNDERPLDPTSLKASTICLMVLRNGFQVIGFSAPADPTNYDAALGRKFARENAIRQLWPLMGFALRDQMNQLDQFATKGAPTNG